jgi:3-methyladenine DNA glycosylase AlkD
MASVEEVLERLRVAARPDQVEGMARYGMSAEARLGVSVPDMRRIAKAVGRDHSLALALWETGIAEARIVAALVGDPKALTEGQMEDWVKDFNSWDVCDQVCLNLFDKTPLAWKKVADWSFREEEFVRRAAFALIACLAWHDKKATDESFIALFPIIRLGATDDRGYVKKAVSWALRHIGKRNARLNQAALALAQEISLINSRAARWVASDAKRELESKSVQRRLGAA